MSEHFLILVLSILLFLLSVFGEIHCYLSKKIIENLTEQNRELSYLVDTKDQEAFQAQKALIKIRFNLSEEQWEDLVKSYKTKISMPPAIN